MEYIKPCVRLALTTKDTANVTELSTPLPLFCMRRDPKALQLLLKLLVERSHSLWKEPEVLTWLEENARQVVARVDAKDTLVTECSAKWVES